LTRRFPRSRRQRRTRIATEGANGSRSEIAEDGKNWKTDFDVTYTKVGWIDSSRDAVLLLRGARSTLLAGGHGAQSSSGSGSSAAF
jgi:hypothetical protein